MKHLALVLLLALSAFAVAAEPMVATGRNHALYLADDGTVWAWGDNTNGQLGTGDTSPRYEPVQVAGLSNIIQVSAGYSYSAALRGDGTVFAWGDNGYAQMGSGAAGANQLTPYAVPLANIKAISAGAFTLFALRTDGNLFGWGYNGQGQSGTGVAGGLITSPTVVTGGKLWRSVCGGWLHAMAIRDNGELWVWGNNQEGNFGNGASGTISATPIQVAALSNVMSMGAGYFHSLAITANGSFYAWGYNLNGQLGVGDTTNRLSPTSVGVSVGIRPVVGNTCSMVLRSNGFISLWGDNAKGQIRLAPGGNRLTPYSPGVTIRTASTGCGDFFIAINGDGTVVAWGDNSSGQLGIGATSAATSFPVPVHATWPVSKMTSALRGQYNAAAVKSDGTVWSWSNNGNGQVGDTSTLPRSTPVQATGVTGVTSISGGGDYGDHVLALDFLGRVTAWGRNTEGQVGDGTNATPRTTPAVIASASWRAIAAGDEHSLAINSSGNVQSWGLDSSGQLGNDAAFTSSFTPVAVSTASVFNIIQVAAGNAHSVALRADGTVWTWGSDASGQLGNDAAFANQALPVQVAGLANVVQITAGSYHSLALRSDGTVWTWGRNDLGQGGDNTTTPHPTAVQVVGEAAGNLTDVRAIAGGCNHSFAIKGDGTLRTWGSDVWGELGDGGSTARLRPGAIALPTTVAMAEGGYIGSVAVLTDGSVSAWGYNGTYAIGDGTSNHASTGVPTSPTWLPQVAVDLAGSDLIGSEASQIAGLVRITRTGSTAGSLSVPYAMTGTATSGSDYTTGTTITIPWSKTAANAVIAVIDDNYDEDDESATVTVTATPSNLSLGGTTAGTVTLRDNDSAGFTVTSASGNTTEAGGTATCQVRLTSQPNADVTIAINSSNTSEGTVSVSSLTFTNANWNQVQTVTITGVNDFVDDGNVSYTVITGAAVSADAKYAGLNPSDVGLLNLNDDTAGFTVSAISGNTTEAGGSATFTIRLNSQPTSSVSLGLASSNVAEGTVSSASLNFTTANWNNLQTVTVTGVDDFIADGPQTYSVITAPAVSSDTRYNGLNPLDVTLANNDNDTAGVLLSKNTASVTEGGATDSYTIRLQSQPLASVTVALTTADGQTTTSPASVTFTTANWNSPQTVTVTAVDDNVAEASPHTGVITHAVTVADGGAYTLVLGCPTVTASITDNDTADLVRAPASGLVTTESGGATTFTLRLATRPIADVSVTIATGNAAEGTVTPAICWYGAAAAGLADGSSQINKLAWNSTRTVTITGVDDALADGNIAYLINCTASSADPRYNTMLRTVAATNNDNEARGVAIVQSGGSTLATEGGATDTYTIALTSAPIGGAVQVQIAGDGQVTPSAASVWFAATAQGLANGGSALNALAWNTPFTVTVTAVNDSVAEGPHTGTVTHTVNAPGTDYAGLTVAAVVAQITDNDSAGFTVSVISGNTTEAGGTATFTVRLTSQPTADVSMSLTSSNTAEGTVSTPVLWFGAAAAGAGNGLAQATKALWSNPITVTVSGVDDFVADGNITYSILTGTASSADLFYNGIKPANVTVINNDNDAKGLTFAAVPASIQEGNSSAYQVRLSSQPTGTVVVTLSGDSQINVSPATLTFTSGTWNVNQTVTATPVDDPDIEAAQSGTITHAFVGSQADYTGVASIGRTITLTDNDAAGFNISAISGPTTESGGTATFTVQLTARPTVSVSINLSSDDATEGTVSPASLSFTNGNWNVAQTVTVTGVDDLIADGNITYHIVTSVSTSADPNFNNLNPTDVTVLNLDNDGPGVAITPLSGLTCSESGAVAIYSVRLINIVPTGTVTIGLTNPSARVQLSTNSLLFDASNWNIAKLVTVSATSNTVADGTALVGIQHAITATGDAVNYPLSMTLPNVSVNCLDDDTASATVTPTGGTTVLAEGGATDTYSLALGTQPTGANQVVISLIPDAQVTSSIVGGKVYFAAAAVTTGTGLSAGTARAWNDPLVITVTAVDDSVAEGAHTGNITHQIDAATTASEFLGVAIASLPVFISDNDTAGMTVSPTSGLVVTEANGANKTATFTVVLTSQPTAGIAIALSSSDSTAGTVSPSSLVFTAGNWNVAQTVTVTGVNDDLADGTQNFTILTAAAVSTDPAYHGLDPTDVTASCLDDDTAGVLLSTITGTSSEGGAGDSYTLRLRSQPLGPVVVTLAPDAQVTATGPGALSTLSFTTVTWNIPQTVNVAAVDDSVAEGSHSGIISHSVTTGDGGAYTGALACPQVTITITDNDTAAVIASKNTLAVSEGGAGDSFTLRLATQPTGIVAVTTAPDSQLTVGSGTVYFAGAVQGSGVGTLGNAALWSNPIAVTVMAVDDAVAEGTHGGTLTLSAVGGGYDPVAISPITAAITDNDTAGITVTPTSGLNVTEAGGQAFFAVTLNSQPAGANTVTIALSLSAPDASKISISPVSLSFTSANWNQAQLVTISGTDDFIADGDYVATVVTGVASSGDSRFNGINPPDVSVTNVDNDRRGVTITESGGSTQLAEGGATDSYTVVLTSQPTAPVAITLLPDGQVTATGPGGTGVLFFAAAASGSGNGSSAGNPAAWNTSLTVTVVAVDDAVAEASPHTGVVTHSAGGGDYTGLLISSITTSITDNDTAGIALGAVSHPVTEAGVALVGPLGSYVSASLTTTTVQFPGGTNLSTLLAGNWIGLSAGPNAGRYARIASVDDPNDRITLADPLTADATARTISVYNESLSSASIAGAVVTFPAATTLSSLQPGQYIKFISGPNNGTTTQVAVVDNAAHTLTVTAPLIASASADSVTFFAGMTVVLTSQPTASVTVPLHSGDTTVGTMFPSSVTFTPVDWNQPRTIAIAGVDNPIDDGDQAFTIITDPATSLDTRYNGTTGTPANALRIDNDVRGVAVSAPSGPTSEIGGTATFTVVLTSQPTASVTIPVASSTILQGTVSLASLTFTPADWDVAQTVTVTGQDGSNFDHGAGTTYTVILGAIGGSSDYASLDPADVTMLNLGVNNQPVFDTINNVTLAEDFAPYTVNVTGLDAGQPGEVQTFTVTAVSDSPGIIPNPAVTYPGAGGAGTADLLLTPVANASGATTITVTLTDSGDTANGGSNTYLQTFIVTVTPVNDPPIVDLNGVAAGTGVTSTFTEGGGAVLIVTPDLTTSDVDDVALSSAEATFSTGAPQDGALESLSVNTAGSAITASYNSATGSLLLSAGTPQPIADFQTVLRTLSYNNLNGAPNITDRQVLVTLNDGATDGPAATATIHVNDVPFLPGVDLNGPVAGIDNPTTFTEGGSAVTLGTSLLDVTDPDSTTITQAVATISNIQDVGSEFLAVDVGATGLVASYTAPTMTITGTASNSTYTAVMRTLTYTDSSQTSTAGVRTVQVTVKDGTNNTSAPATSSITVVPVNDPPTLATNGFTISLGQTYTLSTVELNASDIETSDPAQLTFVVDLIPGQGVLRNNGAPLAINGTFTKADLLANLVTYTHTAPVGGSDGFALRVTDPNSGSSPLRPVIVAINGAAPPVVVLNGPALVINEQAPATVIDADIGTSVTDADTPAFNGGNLTVSFGASSDPGDLIAVPAVVGGGVVTVGGVPIGTVGGVNNDGTGGHPLVISFLTDGTATPTRVTTLLKTLTFNTTSDTPPAGDRNLVFTVNDGGVSSVLVNKQVTITVFDDPPVVTPPAHPLVVVPGIALSAQVQAVDPEGGALVYTVINPPSQGTLTAFNTSTGAFTYRALPTASANTDSFRIAIDDGVNTVNYDYPVRISLVGNPAPLITSLPPMGVNQNKTLLTYVPTVSTAGLAAPALRFILIGTLPGAAFNTATGAINWPGAPIAPPAGGSAYFEGGILVIDDTSETAGYQPYAIFWTPGGPG